jgi:ribonuclease-3
LLITAFTHSSYANYQNEKSNERYEFLGDTVLNSCTTFFLFDNFNEAEGELSKVRAFLISSKNISACVDKMGIIEHLRSFNFDPSQSEGIKCDLFEAVLGAMYLDSNFKTCSNFIIKKLGYTLELVENLMEVGQDFKTRLQELVQKLNAGRLEYKLMSKTGPSHSPTFTAGVVLKGKIVSQGQANNKKQAENLAAEKAIEILSKK